MLKHLFLLVNMTSTPEPLSTTSAKHGTTAKNCKSSNTHPRTVINHAKPHVCTPSSFKGVKANALRMHRKNAALYRMFFPSNAECNRRMKEMQIAHPWSILRSWKIASVDSDEQIESLI